MLRSVNTSLIFALEDRCIIKISLAYTKQAAALYFVRLFIILECCKSWRDISENRDEFGVQIGTPSS